MKRYILKYTYLLTTSIFVFVLFSCSSTENEEVHSSAEYIYLNYTVDDDTQTRAFENELKIESGYFIFYDQSGIYLTYISPAHSKDTYSLNLNITGLQKGVNYKTLIIGNHEYINNGKAKDFILANKHLTFDEMKAFITASSPINKGPVNGKLPFTGTLIGLDNKEEEFFRIPSDWDDNDNIKLSIRYQRAVSRITLVNKVPQKLKVTHVKLACYKEEGYLFSDHIGAKTNLGLSSLSPSDSKSDYIEVGDPVNSSQTVKSGLYCYSNFVPTVSQNDKVTTCLMVYGLYGNDTSGSFYRVNIANSKGVQYLAKNHTYEITIKNVQDRGGESEEEAFYNANANFTGSIKEFSTSNGGNIHIPGNK